ncbi:Phospholipase A-2-activating protein [Camellia lanceoleosa]|uniref:Phospholipase A-2-activating protein n=1 Tax=Camellia lanceoleosa TaxID=1840588 RepID=A0ACC0GMN8_9ERIC|nr:Phospholipase A-2-activating protein [Camellia lanceoleosa]
MMVCYVDELICLATICFAGLTALLVYSANSRIGMVSNRNNGPVGLFCSADADGVCVQSIEHPGCVWDVKFLENGDIVTACSDGVVRFWTIHQDKDKVANSAKLESFASQISYYKCVAGTRDGQTNVVREGDNGVAYSWNMEQQWDKNMVQEFHKPFTEEGPMSIKDDAIVHVFGPERRVRN